jgi:hypothetical protein
LPDLKLAGLAVAKENTVTNITDERGTIQQRGTPMATGGNRR